MNAFEISDRRKTWEGGREAETVETLSLQHGYLIGETLTSVRLQGGSIDEFAILDCTFEGGHWLGVKLGKVDFSQTRFRHTYFEAVDFRQASFTSSCFEHCTFVDCHWPAEEEGLEVPAQQGCLHRRFSAALPAPVASAPRVERQETPAAPVASAPAAPNPVREPSAAKPAAPAAQDRFDRLER